VAKAKSPRKPTWRDYEDALHRTFPARPNPESLHPGASTVERAITGNLEARAIMDSYAFRFPVTVVEVLP
jgi:hypothetical protein